MSTNEKGGSTVTVSTDPATDPASAGSHTDTAQERILELQRWREQIPRLAIPATPDAAKRLSSAASVSPAFIELTNVALANQPVLVRTEGATPAQVRDMVSYADAYSPLADELEALAHFVRYSVTAARNAAGNEALTTYSLAQRMAKLPRNAHLKPYLADMRRALGRGRKLTPEEAAKNAAERAAKAAAKVAKKTPTPKPPAPAPIPTTPQPS